MEVGNFLENGIDPMGITTSDGNQSLPNEKLDAYDYYENL